MGSNKFQVSGARTGKRVDESLTERLRHWPSREALPTTHGVAGQLCRPGKSQPAVD
jgi:hypothetical protein